jgi:hypothetical protein
MSTMTDTETYNGWKNRETWAFNLHWSNDQGLYNETLEQARLWAQDYPMIAEADHTGRLLGEAVVNFWREMIEDYADNYGTGLPEVLRMMDREVGSWWRVDPLETGAAVRESLENEE